MTILKEIGIGVMMAVLLAAALIYLGVFWYWFFGLVYNSTTGMFHMLTDAAINRPSACLNLHGAECAAALE